MNRQVGLLVCLCCLAGVTAGQGQTIVISDNNARPSHRPLDDGVGDLKGAEDLLARRLHHTHDMEGLQDLVKPLLEDPEFRRMLKQKLKDLKSDDKNLPAEIEKLKETIKKNPEILDDPKLRDLLKDLGQFKQNGGLDGLTPEKKDQLAKWAKDFIDKDKLPDPVTGNPNPGAIDPKTPQGPTPAPNPTPNPADATKPPASASDSKPEWLNRDMVDSVANFFRNADKSGDGDALKGALREFVRLGSDSSGSSSGMGGFLKGVINSNNAGWLSDNLKPPSGMHLGGDWSGGPSLPAGSSLGDGGSPGGMLDGLVWIIALALLGAATWLVFTMMRRQATAARGKSWSPGPWPVDPSRVSTRADLIRAFEHLAFLLLGRGARTLNHLDVASRVGGNNDGRAEAAARLAHLYEQARYAPPDELLPVNELEAARGDLSSLAGAAA